MFGIALRGVKNNVGRYVATLVAIVVGVSFFAATGFLSSRVIDSLEGDANRQYGNVDVAIVPKDESTDFAKSLVIPVSDAAVSPGRRRHGWGRGAHRSGVVPRRRRFDLWRRHDGPALDHRPEAEPAGRGRGQGADRRRGGDRPGHRRPALARRRRHRHRAQRGRAARGEDQRHHRVRQRRLRRLRRHRLDPAGQRLRVASQRRQGLRELLPARRPPARGSRAGDQASRAVGLQGPDR